MSGCRLTHREDLLEVRFSQHSIADVEQICHGSQKVREAEDLACIGTQFDWSGCAIPRSLCVQCLISMEAVLGTPHFCRYLACQCHLFIDSASIEGEVVRAIQRED